VYLRLVRMGNFGEVIYHPSAS